MLKWRDVRASLAPGRLTPGPRVLKSAVAVGMAWWIASALLGESRPVFAAMGAFVAMERTIVRSLRRTVLQIAGVAGGVVLAFLLVHLLGITALGAALAILTGLVLGRLVGSPERVGVELSVTALLVVGLAGGDPTFGVTRLWETALGGLVSVAINALIVPPDHLRQLGDELEALASVAAQGLVDVLWSFAADPAHAGAREATVPLKAARDTLGDLDTRVALAAEALRLNPFPRDKPRMLARYREAASLYGRALVHATIIGRTVGDHAALPHSGPHERLAGPDRLLECAQALSRALLAYQAYVATGTPTALAEVRREVARAQRAVSAFLAVAEHERSSDTAVRRLIDIGVVGSELAHLTSDIAETVDGGPRAPTGEPPPCSRREPDPAPPLGTPVG